jgi:hypothetical protein
MEIGYLSDGTKVEILSESPCIVCEIVEVYPRDDGEPFEEEGRTYPIGRSKVYSKPPKKVLNEEIARLKAEIDAYRDELGTYRNELLKLKAERKADIEKFSQVDFALSTLRDVFDGNITHFVYTHYSDVEIIDALELADKMSSRDRLGEYGLLHLNLSVRFAKTPTWSVVGEFKDYNRYNQYLERNDILPCSSYEQAVEKLGVILNERISGGEVSVSILNAAAKYGISIPDDYADRIKDRKISDVQHHLDECRHRMEELEASIAEIRGEQ